MDSKEEVKQILTYAIEKIDNMDSPQGEEKSNVIDDILYSGKEKTTLCGFYIEQDLVKVLDRLSKESGKKGSNSIKSKLVNEALRKLFEENGLM